MKYICLFTEENTEGNLTAKINCIKLRKAAWSETFIPYGNIVKNTKVLFSKKAHDHRITMQAIDFDNVNEVSFWIDTPEFLGINMTISDGHYYQYGESDQVGYFYFFACFGQRLVLYKFFAFENALHLGNETFQMHLSDPLTKITFINTIKDTVYSLFSYKQTDEVTGLPEEVTYLTSFNIKENRTLAYKVKTEKNRIPLFLSGKLVHIAVKDLSKQATEKEIYYVKSTVFLESANIAVGIEFKPRVIFTWQKDNNVTLNVDLNNPYFVIDEFSVTGKQIPPITFTYINTSYGQVNLTKNLTLKPAYISIQNGDTFSVDVTRGLNISENVKLCEKKYKPKREKNCDQFDCKYYKNKKTNNLKCSSKIILESPNDFRTYFDNELANVTELF
ncbi:unnamed protein product [Moneuplotes crassus]|uniref:Uncharacterized protein n=1 Tax=Euplotes crassus TaxID=5936 RepID=A0AAD2D1Y4_EUPCR|nr:unnamed protein product [Moneuplotes crassus]